MISKHCTQCGVEFFKNGTHSRKYWATRRFCSRRCGVLFNVHTHIPRMIAARNGRAWNKGKPLSEQHRRALSAVRRGKPYSAERRQKMISRIKAVRGDDWTPNTIHAIKDAIQYRTWRRLVFERDEFCCVTCGYKSQRRVNGRADIQADHIMPFSLIVQNFNLQTREQAIDCAALWDVANGQTLCVACHKRTATYGRNALYQKYEPAALAA